MASPEPAALAIKLRPSWKPKGLQINSSNVVFTGLGLLAGLGLVMLILRIASTGDDRTSWAYPTAFFMWTLSTFATAPLVAYVTRLTRGYWGYPIRRLAALWSIPALFSYLILLPSLATLPSLDGRASLWFGFRFGVPGFADALTIGFMFVTGIALMWITSIPDLASGDVRLKSPIARSLLMNWRGTTKQWLLIRSASKYLGAFYVMLLAIGTMQVTTDMGQSLIPGWRSGIFPLYHIVTGFQAGVAVIIVTTYLLQKFSPNIRPFIGQEQAINLGRLLLAFTLLDFYFFWADYVLIWYAGLPSEIAAMQVLIADVYRIPFIAGALGIFVIPFFAIIFNPVRRRLWALALISTIIIIGNFFDRVRLFVPAMSNEKVFGHGPLNPLPSAVWPDVSDILFIVSWVALMVFIYLAVARRIPAISGWEMREGAMLRKETHFERGHIMLLAKPE
tara:strand:+ start:1626 stop:2972 length:1347 start_codon:yes stop_codon:yes gene_type:complete